MPNDARSLTMRAETYSGIGQFDLALSDRTQVIELEPSTNHRYFERADVYRAMGKFELALADIEQGFATDAVKDAARFPRARAYALRGDIYAEELQKYDLAIKEYEQAIELEPNNTSYANKLESAAKAILPPKPAASSNP